MILLFSIISLPAKAGDVYSWEDKNGMHFVDDPSKVPAKYRNQMKSDTDAARISANNEFKGYTKNGIKTDKAWQAEIAISETEYKREASLCINSYKYDKYNLDKCINEAANRHISRTANVPEEVRKARFNERTSKSSNDQWNDLGKIK